jgi:hypothetical protein
LLIVVKGTPRLVEKRILPYKHRSPSFYMVSAVQQVDGNWQLPLTIDQQFAWLWQRWGIEVAHWEIKTNRGIGEKQSWNTAFRSAFGPKECLGLCHQYLGWLPYLGIAA